MDDLKDVFVVSTNEEKDKDGINAKAENDMKSENFVNELNNNISSIESDVSLNQWKYKEENYPTF